MPENRYASDIVKKNAASTEFINRQINNASVAKGLTGGVFTTVANTATSKEISIAYGAQYTDPSVLSTVVNSFR